MKIAITIITFFAIATVSFAQISHDNFEDINFGASAKIKKSTTKASAFKVGRIEETGNFTLFVPLAFSPNGDGIDDHLQIESYNVIQFEFTLFDQSGEFQLNSDDPNFNWDGTVNEEKLNAGLYIYTIKLTTLDGQIIKNSGTIMIEQ